MNLGNRISKLRKEKKWSQKELGNCLHVTDKTICSWESNRTEPSLEDILKLSEVLDCSIGFLMYGQQKRTNIETEIRINLSKTEYEAVKKTLDSNSDFQKTVRQVDTYYQPRHKPFLNEDDTSVDEWLRIGLRGNKKIVNYKKWYDSTYCDEFEVEIDDENNMDKIFEAIDLEKIAVVDKERSTYLHLDKYEIALDSVKNLGFFIEIEVKKYEYPPLEEHDLLLKFAKKLNLNLNNIDKRGYPYHMIYKNRNCQSDISEK